MGGWFGRGNTDILCIHRLSDSLGFHILKFLYFGRFQKKINILWIWRFCGYIFRSHP